MYYDELVLKIYQYLDKGYTAEETADALDITEDRVWQIIESVEKEDDLVYEIPRRHNI